MLSLLCCSRWEEGYMTSRNSIYLPIAAGPPPVPAPPAPEKVFLWELCVAPGQQRSYMVWDECLALAAELRCEQTSVKFDHCYLGDCVNRTVGRYCRLPAEYPENGNSIESLVAGVRDPIKALEFLLSSPAHADHLLGRNDFFRSQFRCGIGFMEIPGTEYTFYYVILISK